MNRVDHINGETFHGRRGSIRNAFRYGVDYVLLDAEKPVSAPFLFSRNRGNILSVRDRDHGGEIGKGTGATWVRQVLQEYQVSAKGRVLLLTQPRTFGYLFNPVSFWLCHDEEDQLRAVIAEVNNTFGDRHSYLCVKPDGSVIDRMDRLRAEKVFYVSPFQPVEGSYTFCFDISEDQIKILIQYERASGGLIATLTGSRRPLTTKSTLLAMLRRPLGSMRVTALIFWQALKLKIKGAAYLQRPTPPAQDVSQ